MLLSMCWAQTAVMPHSRHIGTISMIAVESAKLSYSAERVSHTNRMQWSYPAFVDGVGEKGRRSPPMPRTHPPYAPEYRRRIIELARTGRPIAQLAREFEASANAIRKWVKQAGLDEGLRNDGLTTGAREEPNRLRRENRVLREEREILSKAAAWFATETGSVPSRRSNSLTRIRPATGSPPCAA